MAAAIGERVYNSLKNDILTLKIAPGEQLTEQWICDEYNVSRTPSRDAILRLKDEELIESSPYKVNVVSLMDFNKISELVYMRKIIETKVVKDAIPLINEENLAAFEYNLKLQDIFIKNPKNHNKYYNLDNDFHKICYQVTNKLELWKEIHSSEVHITRYRMLDSINIFGFDKVYDEHRDLYELIKAKNIEAIDSWMIKHLNGGIKRLEKCLTNEYSHYFIQKNNR